MEALVKNPHYPKLSPLAKSLKFQTGGIKKIHLDGTGSSKCVDVTVFAEVESNLVLCTATAAVTWVLYNILTALPGLKDVAKRKSTALELEALLESGGVDLDEASSDIVAHLRDVAKGLEPALPAA